ncbi:MAG: hypothetical protein IIC24_04665, partial [Chloroflexi bacterium]|nr:hypothetical protein [Chloroflexota bacterium]
IAYFVGLESPASGHFPSLNPTPIRQEHKTLQEYFEAARPPLEENMRNLILERVADFPLATKFNIYWDSRFDEDREQIRAFRRLNRLRGELLHGKEQSVTPQAVSEARKLLEKLLATELGISGIVDQLQSGPKVLQATLRYALIEPATS